jgi:hypothetical protein
MKLTPAQIDQLYTFTKQHYVMHRGERLTWLRSLGLEPYKGL